MRKTQHLSDKADSFECGQRFSSPEAETQEPDTEPTSQIPEYDVEDLSRISSVKASRIRYCNDQVGENVSIRTMSHDSLSKRTPGIYEKIKNLTKDGFNFRQNDEEKKKPPVSPREKIEKGMVRNLTSGIFGPTVHRSNHDNQGHK